MARILHRHVYPTLPTLRAFDLGRWLVLVMQLAVLGGIGAFLLLTIVNTILGAPQPEPVYSPYE